MILGIDPKVDYAFKYLLGRESTKAILIDVLNSVLAPPPGHEIVAIELLNPLNLQEALDDKLSILDIKARDQSGRQFNVEMQILAHPYYEKRVVYYAARLHREQLREGQDYGLLCQTISISFLNHALFPQVTDYHLRFHLLEDRHHFQMTDDLEFHFLELPKFNKGLDKLKTGLDLWLYFLRNAEKIDGAALPAVLEQPAIVRAVEELRMLTQSDIEREKYEARRKYQLDRDSAIIGAERLGEQRGEQRGQQRGKQIGLIHAYEQMLRLPETPDEQLLALPLDDLTRVAEVLKQQALGKR